MDIFENNHLYELDEARKQSDEKRRLDYDKALTKIRKTIGYKEVGEYTFEDAVDYFKLQYGAKKIVRQDCLNYLWMRQTDIEQARRSSDPVFCLTEGFCTTADCTILLLPNHTGIPLKKEYDGCILFLNEHKGKLQYGHLDGTRTDYGYYEIDIFCGKSCP